MKYNISNNKLKVIIDELGEEYKDLLIEHLLDDIGDTDVDHINPLELIKLDISTKINLRISKKNYRLNRMHSMISLLGIIYAFLGLIIMIANLFIDYINYNSTMLISLVLIFLGLVVVLFSTAFKYLMKNQPNYYLIKRNSVSRYEIINKWKELEALMYELTPPKNSYSISSMIKSLKETKIISDQDTKIIREILSTRNQIVHNDAGSDLSQVRLRKMLIEVDEVISKMKKII